MFRLFNCLSILLTFCCFILFVRPSPASENRFQAPLKGLRQEHPRLLVLPNEIQRVQRLLTTDDAAKELHAVFERTAKELTGVEPVFYPEKGNLLGRARKLLKRVYLLGLLAQLTNDPKERQAYAAEAWRQIEPAVCSRNWAPNRKFLSIGETTHALAIAYDWFYQDLNSSQRARLGQAILDQGLKRYLRALKEGANWLKKEGNWIFVCHGGIALGVLAIAEDHPDLAEQVLSLALPAIARVMGNYTPDGAWWEGPTYWSYATSYAVYTLAGLRTSLGHDFGLSKTPGFSDTGLFALYLAGPMGNNFSFADSSIRGKGPKGISLFWLSRQFDLPLYAWLQRERYVLPRLKTLRDVKGNMPFLERKSLPHPLNLLWYSTAGSPELLERLPSNRLFRGHAIEVASFRENWGPESMFLGVKGGGNNYGHSHLDLGSFVLDAGEQRWALDLGKDDYRINGYWDIKKGRRWRFYRTGTRGHNTLLINDANQKTDAVAKVIDFVDCGPEPGVTLDLTDAYNHHGVKVARRKFIFHEKKKIVVNDHIVAERPVMVEWGMHTGAKVSTNGNRSVFKKGGRQLTLVVVAPEKIAFRVEPARPGPNPSGQNPNTNVSRLFFRLPEKVTEVVLKVEMSIDSSRKDHVR
jgi:Heparinase II/III-like protein